VIIDSHTHYAHARFDGGFPYLCKQGENIAVGEATREQLLEEIKAAGIVGAIEAAIHPDGIEKQAKLLSTAGLPMWITVGIHPTRCINTPWKKHSKLADYSQTLSPIAIGETGLDYHYPRKNQHRLRQTLWFLYQLRLADRLQLPLVLHIREADRHALRILKKYRSHLHGGVVHCFSGGLTLANEYISLGFALGIGGKLLCDDEYGKRLSETVKSVPLSALLVETDAPFVLPDTGELPCSKKKRRKLCNSSLILPEVIGKIAELREEEYETVERAIYENTVRVFGLPKTEERNK
jgi:TatD DNase family protein